MLVACNKDNVSESNILDDTLLSVSSKVVPDVSVMTYNIHMANPPSAGSKRDLSAIALVIRAANPDIVALQEVDIYTERSGFSLHQAKELGKLTNMHAFFVKATDVFNGGEAGNAILSKFPILDSVGYELPADPNIGGEMRNMAVIRVALPDGRRIVFASTHLDHKSEDNRLYQGERLRKILQKEEFPVLLAGDYNALPTSLTIELLDKYFIRTCKHNCSPTFPAYNPKSSIDFIMYRNTDKVTVVSNNVIFESYASDHLPVVAGIKFE